LPFQDYVDETPTDGRSLEDEDDTSDDFEDYNEDGVGLCRLQHASYAGRGLRGLPGGYSSLDASRPWLCYWILNALDLLNALPAPSSTLSATSKPPTKRPASSSSSSTLASMTSRVVDFLKRCQAPTGGFGGGPGQLPHMAPTYAAVNALVIIGTEEAYSAIDRPGLHAFLLARKRPDGSFTMHEDGEVDIRGTYCGLAAAALANVLTDELVAGTPEYLASCQTYEGGMGGEPGNEAHGGYAYCGVSALAILGELRRLDLPALLKWTCERQMRFEGGFQGRTNKLVDSCYSYWQSAIFPQIQPLLHLHHHHHQEEAIEEVKRVEEEVEEVEENDEVEEVEEIPRPGRECEGDLMFDQLAVQAYILACCQDIDGGLRDKPPKYRDYYHTCYALAGLAVTQHNIDPATMPPTCLHGRTATDLLKRIDPSHGISVEKVQRARRYFQALPAVNK
jgi:protein farnesyltransferase subunit beta